MVSNYYNKNILLNVSEEKEIENFKLYKNIIDVNNFIAEICFGNNLKLDKDKIIKTINDTRNILLKNLENEQIKENQKDYSKDYRAYREIDNFAENYITVSVFREKFKFDKTLNSCGMSYGGIELPILHKIISKNEEEKSLLLKFNKEVSGYTNKQLLNLRNFNINKLGGIVNSDDFINNDINLFDDNVLTGKTLQLAINSLYDCDINVKNICIVRYPSINRIDQMFLDKSSAIEYNLFFNYIYDLCFNSPYSWKDDDWKIEKGKIDYTDTLGIFDLNRRKIVECLIKNHDFNENSEVGEIKRKLLK